MKRIIIGAMCLLPCVTWAQKGFTITGKVGKLNAPSIIFLSYEQNGEKIIDSVELKKGKFKFTGAVDTPTQGLLSVRHNGVKTKWPNDWIHVYMENVDMEVTAQDSIKHATVKGSPLYDDSRVLAAADKPIRHSLDSLRDQWKNPKPEDRKGKVYEDAVALQGSLMKKLEQAYIDFAMTHNNYVGLDAYNRAALSYEFNAAEAEKVFERFPEDVKRSDIGKQARKKIEGAKKREVGQVLPDFTQPDMEGKSVTLSDFRGQYVFIDFWASWCKPCRAENPNVLKAYNRFKDKNFQIIGISLDDNKKAWTYAVEQDGMPWIQVSDLKGFKNAVSSSLGITAIPQNVLINPKGEIIARNLRGEDLDEQLAKYIEK